MRVAPDAGHLFVDTAGADLIFETELVKLPPGIDSLRHFITERFERPQAIRFLRGTRLCISFNAAEEQ